MEVPSIVRTNVLIVGGGAADIFAAIYATRHGVQRLISSSNSAASTPMGCEVHYACIAKFKGGLTHLDSIPEQRALRDLSVDTQECNRTGYPTAPDFVDQASDGDATCSR
jgi:hypothetical protein